MVDWQVTATTILCDAVAEEVTIMVFKDGSVKCVGYQRYGAPGRETAKLRQQRGRGKKLECAGPECPQVLRYRDRLFAEEKVKMSQSSPSS